MIYYFTSDFLFFREIIIIKIKDVDKINIFISKNPSLVSVLDITDVIEVDDVVGVDELVELVEDELGESEVED